MTVSDEDRVAEIAADLTTEQTAPLEIYDEERGELSSGFLDSVSEAIEASDEDGVRRLTADLHEADLADLIEALKAPERAQLVEMLGSHFDFAALTELDESLRVSILEALPAEVVAAGVSELESDDAVLILDDLDAPDQAEILAQIPVADRIALQRSLDYPEETAGRLMSSDFIAVPPFWSVGQTIDYMRDSDDLPDEFYEIFIVDPGYRLLGTVSLNHLLRTKRPTKISEIMNETRYVVEATEDQEEVAYMFEHYNLVSAAVTDASERLVGVITIDDIVDVIHLEAEEDMRALSGVGDEEISDSVFDITKSRFTWLLINLGTAILASAVIGLFDATIEQMVALAVLMPIVASMGGNAGTQTLTVAVRALATRDIGSYNVWRVVTRETFVGFINGCLFAIIMGLVAGFWFKNPELGGVIAAAMVINLVMAGLAGILVPLTLDKLGIDPAIASAVFVTTVTDVVGFFAFLGLAALWFGLI